MNTTTAIASLGVPPDIEQRASAVLREMGWSVAEAVRLLLTRIANEGRFPLVDGAAQDAEDARAEALKANLEESLTGDPVDADFLSGRPDGRDFERADKLFEGWE